MLLWNTIKLTDMALSLRAEILNPVDVIFLVCKPLRMIDTEMLEFRYIQHVITSPAVLIEDTVGKTLRSIMGYNVIDKASAITFRIDLTSAP